MGLSEYKRKRNFKDTPEPGAKVERTKRNRFVIQRHDATRLHYDFRLEMDGVLKSWAVPKGPSKNPKDKRLAVMVEDHPVSYIGFYGSIPHGNYGAGTVDIWDEGTYTPIDAKGNVISEKQALKTLQEGDLKFELSGKHLKGSFALVRMRDEKSWLLIKHRDKFATDEEYTSEDEKPVKPNKKGGEWESNRKTSRNKSSSKISNAARQNNSSKKKVSNEEDNSAQKSTRFNPGRKLEKFITPMLASPGDAPFDHPGWVFELKWDGYRAVAECNNSTIRLYSRNGLSFNECYPAIVEELQKMKLQAVLDGEVVLFNEDDKPDFQKLQHYDSNRHLPLIYYVFDILSLNKKDLCTLPLVERKEILKNLLKKNAVVRYSDHFEENGIDFFEEVRKNNLEGIMAKKADSLYFPGIRTREWLKLKNTLTREAIICGYTEGRGSRKHFGALVLGEFKNSKLHYIGHTGTGFNDKTLKELWTLMQQYRQEDSPFAAKIAVNSAVTWLQPKLVAEVKFTEMTRDGILRHPVFLHLREDKPPAEVKPVPEIVSAPSSSRSSNHVKSKAKNTKQKSTSKKNLKNESTSPIGNTSNDENDKTIIVNNRKVELSNINKIYWPDEKITKGRMIEYYESIADYILPYLKDRPLSLLRNPNGIQERGFFHKNAGDVAPAWMTTAEVYSESNDKTIRYLVCNDKPSLLFIANLGVIEMNPWNSTIKKQENPTWMVIDIDPSDGNIFDEVVETAQVVKEVLLRGKIDSYCKTSGASGLHVYVPMGGKYTYDQVKDFANLIAMMVTHELPDKTTLERSLSKRSTKKIYIDYLQNRRGQTLATAYSLRPKPGATVSTPLDWKEVKPGLHPSEFNIANTLSRVKKKGDLFLPVLGKGIDLRNALRALGQ